MPVFGGPTRIAVVLAGLLCAATCGDSEPSLGPTEDLPITRLTQPGFSGYDSPQRLVIRTEAAWREAWQAIWRRSTEVPPLPPVNFGTEMVILAAAGAKPTSGYFIAIDAVTANRRTATIHLRSITPGANCVVLPVVTQPLEAVRIAARDEVTFAEVSETRACPS